MKKLLLGTGAVLAVLAVIMIVRANTVFEETCASLTAFSFISEAMASSSELGLNRTWLAGVVRLRKAFSGLGLRAETRAEAE